MDIERGVSPIDRTGATQGYSTLNQSIRNSNTFQIKLNQEQLALNNSNAYPIIISNNDSQRDRVEKAIEHLNKIAQESDVNVEMEYNKDADRVVIKFVDGQNNKVVKQIPSDAVLDMNIQVRKFVGLLFNKMV